MKENVVINETTKCTVSGCRIPARLALQTDLLAHPWFVCGVHRAEVAMVLNEASHDYNDGVHEARKKAVARLVEGINELGDHEAELSLAK